MVTITCVTENTARPSSSYWGEHGLAFLIDSNHGCVLFDTGQTAYVALAGAFDGDVHPCPAGTVLTFGADSNRTA